MLIGAFGEVNEGMLAEVGSMILQAGSQREDVTLIISTYGGDLYPALGLHNLLRHHVKQGYNVTTIAVGACMSAGLVMLQAGSNRAMTENSFLMTHYGQDGSASVDDVKQNERMHEVHKAIVTDRVKVSKRTINSWYRSDTYFDAKHALKVGLVDEVILNE